MKTHFIQQIQRRLRHARHGSMPPPGTPHQEPPTRSGSFRAWLRELSEDLANIDRSGKDDPRSRH